MPRTSMCGGERIRRLPAKREQVGGLMAYHYPEQWGHTKPIVGAWYTQFTRSKAWRKLRSFNLTTGMATFTSGEFIRLSDLSRWYKVQDVGGYKP